MMRKYTFLHFIKISLMLVLFLQAGKVEAQTNLTMKAYGYIGGSGINVDGATLDQIFGTVTINGTVVTGNYTPTLDYTNLPTTVAGFAGIQAVAISGMDYAPYGTISVAQADALIAYVKGGGILIGNMEGLKLSNGTFALKYLAEALFCTPTTLTPSAFGADTANPSYAYHPNDGALLLNANAPSVVTTGSFAGIKGVPSENIVYIVSGTATCTDIKACDFVVPAYPGCNSCGVNGIALFSGEIHGILTPAYRAGTQSNKNYAQLMYDLLYNPSAMATRRAWSTISTNTNTTCPPAVLPSAKTPTLSATTKTNTCPSATLDLNSLVTSATPSGASLKWYSDNTHTTEVTTPTAVAASGTYYAFYVDTVNNCYSPASAAVTATINACPVNLSNTCPSPSVDLALSHQGTVPNGYTLTFHSGTPATDANKLTSSVVTASGTYYGAYYFAGQTCYSATGRPLVVTITNCCAAQTLPDLTN